MTWIRRIAERVAGPQVILNDRIFVSNVNSCSRFILFTGQEFLWFSDQELLLDLTLRFAKNRCRQEIEWPERDLRRLYIFLVGAAEMQMKQGCEAGEAE